MLVLLLGQICKYSSVLRLGAFNFKAFPNPLVMIFSKYYFPSSCPPVPQSSWGVAIPSASVSGELAHILPLHCILLHCKTLDYIKLHCTVLNITKLDCSNLLQLFLCLSLEKFSSEKEHLFFLNIGLKFKSSNIFVNMC